MRNQQRTRSQLAFRPRGHHIVDRRVLEPLLAALREFAEVIRKARVGYVDAYAAYVLPAIFCSSASLESSNLVQFDS
jgi:hypothetical protein